ncbi:MAG: hypothetical protein WBL40_18850 [Terrimicrobiaceae bacterium]
MKRMGGAPISNFKGTGYLGMTFVTTKRQPVAGEVGCLIVSFDSSTPERDATTVEAMRTSMNGPSGSAEARRGHGYFSRRRW